METKKCSTCGITKHLDDFHKKTGSRDGKQPRCKLCNIERVKAYYAENSADRIEYQKSWDSENIDRRRINLIKREYGVDESEAIRLESIKSCQICDVAFTVKRFRHIDHDHATGRVRGVLCMGCNTGIGSLRDDVSILTKAIEYLQAGVS